MERELDADRLALLLSTARVNSNRTQKYMAKAMGRSIGTIKNWESGLATPNVLDTLKWFDELGLNPLRFALNFLYPEVFEEIDNIETSNSVRDALMVYFKKVASDNEVKKLSYCIFGNSGSSWLSQLEMLTAHNHTTMKSRVSAGYSIYYNYLMEKTRGELVNALDVLPDEEKLLAAIKKGFRSAEEFKQGYTIK